MSEINNLIKGTKVKFTQKDNKELKEVQKKIDNLYKQKRKTDKQIFKETQGQNLRNLLNQREQLKANKNNKILFNIDNETYAISKKYLDSLKNPSKYISGIHARKLRLYQKKAYKEKNYQAVINLEKKLRGLNQKSSMSKYKLSKSKKEIDLIERAFEIQGIKIPRKAEKDKSYNPIVTQNNEGRINIVNI